VSLPPGLPADWQQRVHSRRVAAAGLDWHVQVAGQGPTVLLLHGTGASAHSWAGLLPLLQGAATVVVPDLPGHAFTRGATPEQLTLPRMAAALGALLQALQLPPAHLVVGHSAGAALALRMALSAEHPPAAVLGFAPSLVAPPEIYTRWLAPLVNPVATSGPVARLMSGVAARSGLIDLLLDSTGSRLTPAQRQPYKTLFSERSHVRGAVGFMAAADLPALNADAARLRSRMAFVMGQGDRWIPERALRPVLQRCYPDADAQAWPGGHLVHEEQPARAAQRVLALLAETRADTTVMRAA
jgi:magnesium chelatase accessory protein